MKVAILFTVLLSPLMVSAESLCLSFAEKAALVVGEINTHGPLIRTEVLKNEKSFDVQLKVTQDGEGDRVATYRVTTTGGHECLVTNLRLVELK
jgi:hypothetical protein